MAEFFVEGRRYVLSKELFDPVIPKMTREELVQSLVDLGVVEAAKEQGKVTCTQEAWNEIMDLGKSLYFEIKWRLFSQSLGIHLEVR